MTTSATRDVERASGSLTAKQQRFVQEYPLDLDLAAAYRRAGYKPKSDEAARTAAHRLLRNVTVWEAIQEAFKARSERTEITADYVLQRLRAEAELMGEEARHSARVRALELLGKNLGLFVDRHEHRHGGDPNAPPIGLQHSGQIDVSKLSPELQLRLLEEIEAAEAKGMPPKSPLWGRG